MPTLLFADLVALQPAPLPDGSRTPILFELLADRLPRLMSEIRRLAPKATLEFRMADWWDAQTTVLVQVTGVPSFTLLRPGDDALTAFHEQVPGIWVEVGYRHPLAEQMASPDERLTLIRGTGRWTVRDLLPPSHEISSFALPASPHALRDQPVDAPLDLPLRLTNSGANEPAELWVIHERPSEQLAELASESGPAFLARFRYSSVAPNGRPLVLLWAEPSKGPPPVPAVVGLGCRPYLKLPNLFLPCGMKLTPPPRRDTARAIAPDSARLTVLLPDGTGGFVPVSVPESAFAPLAEAIDYVTPALRSFEMRFTQRPLEYTSFEECDPSEIQQAGAETILRSVPRESRLPGWWSRLRRSLTPERVRPARPAEPEPEPLRLSDAVGRALPESSPPPPRAQTGRKHDLNDRRTRLEAKFLQALGADGVQKRLAVLPELAGLHAQLGNHADAAVCWINAIWDHDDPPPYWFWGWLQAEKKLGRVLLTEGKWPELLDANPTPHNVRVLAATTVWQATQPVAIGELAGRVRLVLEAHEEWLPVRAAWLAQASLARTAGGDALALARARDRLNERLYHQGLSLERDVPGFLRFAGGEAGERFQAVRDWLDRVRDPIHRWADHLTRDRPADYVRTPATDYPDSDGRQTKAIIDLMLAWGTARLGEQSPARALAEGAASTLRKSDDSALGWIADALEYRVAQTLDGKPAGGPLPAPLHAEAARLTADGYTESGLLARFRIDMVRANLRILEPTWRASAFWPHDRATDAPIIQSPATEPLTAVLLLEETLTCKLAHGDGEAVAELLPRFERLLAPDGPRFATLVERCQLPTPSAGAHGPDDLRRLEALPGRVLRGLRRSGLSGTEERLQLPAVEWVLGGKGLAQLRTAQPRAWLPALRAVLYIAGNWFGGPHEKRAVTVLDFARTSLFYATDLPTPERLALAQAYATAVSHAHPRVAQGRIEELFRDLSGLYDERQTNTHYALTPLALVDAVVRAAVSDDFALSPVARLWLDEDEFRVRARMKRDANEFAFRET